MDDDPVTNNIFTKHIKDRFFKYAPSRNAGVCWNWQGATMKNGYGEFHLHGSSVYAHRISYIIFYGEIPEGLLVRHKCDNKLCVNPKHLELGTHSDNLIDSYTRHPETVGRRWYSKRS
jgi:hypothetical protein